MASKFKKIVRIMTLEVRSDKYNERLQRARSGNKMSNSKPSFTFDSNSTEIDTSTSYGDVESGGVILDSTHADPEDVFLVSDTKESEASNRKFIDRRGPCNRLERGICAVGKKFGVKVVVEG